MLLLDPGHGGREPRGKSTPFGSRAPSGELEKDLVFRLCRRIAENVRYGGGAVGLTREDDRNVSIAERIQRARSLGADAFVSLHAHEGVGAPVVWVHPDASQSALASALAHSLGAPVRSGELAVLDPHHHAPGTASCLVELPVETGPGFVERYASAISEAVGRVHRSEALAVSTTVPKHFYSRVSLTGGSKIPKRWFSQQLSFPKHLPFKKFQIINVAATEESRLEMYLEIAKGRTTRYPGNRDEVADARERAARTRDLFKLLTAQKIVDPKPEVLKVVSAPEFYFRGPHGAYDLQSARILFDALRQGIAEVPDTRSWLFNVPFALRLPRDKAGKVPIVNGLWVVNGTTEHLIQKPEHSPIDFSRVLVPGLGEHLPRRTTGVLQHEIITAAPKEVDKILPELGEAITRSTSVLDVAGVKIAMELCLAHARQTARKELGDLKVPLQVVPSAGMKVHADSLVIPEGGIITLIDSGPGLPQDHFALFKPVDTSSVIEMYDTFVPAGKDQADEQHAASVVYRSTPKGLVAVRGTSLGFKGQRGLVWVYESMPFPV